MLLKEEIRAPSFRKSKNVITTLGIISDLARTPGLYFAHANLHDLNAANDISVTSAERARSQFLMTVLLRERTRDVFHSFVD